MQMLRVILGGDIVGYSTLRSRLFVVPIVFSDYLEGHVETYGSYIVHSGYPYTCQVSLPLRVDLQVFGPEQKLHGCCYEAATYYCFGTARSLENSEFPRNTR